MRLSPEVITAMGFQPIESVSPITATFHSLNIYQIEGLSLANDAVDYTCYDSRTGIRFCFGNDINEIFKALVNDTWTDTQEDHDEWQEGRKARPPHLVVHTQASHAVTVNAGLWMRVAAKSIHTYDTFKAERKALQQFENGLLPKFLFSLSAELSSGQRVVYFRNLTRHVYGMTPQGDQVHDFVMTGSVNVSLSQSVAPADIASAASSVINAQPKSLPSPHVFQLVSQWFNKGIDEIDSFNKFRCFYVVIERLTKDAYPEAARLRSANDLLTTRLAHLVPKYQQQISGKMSIFIKFLWCAAILWAHLSDNDIDEMYAVTQLRHAAYHGDASTDEVYPYLQLQKLALKLMK